jgi:hypothetical protein
VIVLVSVLRAAPEGLLLIAVELAHAVEETLIYEPV